MKFFKDANNNNANKILTNDINSDDYDIILHKTPARKVDQIRSIFQQSNHHSTESTLSTIVSVENTITSTLNDHDNDNDDDDIELNNDSGKENYDSCEDAAGIVRNLFNITNISSVQRNIDDSPILLCKTFESSASTTDVSEFMNNYSSLNRNRSKSLNRTIYQQQQQSHCKNNSSSNDNNVQYSDWIENKRKSIQKSKSFATPADTSQLSTSNLIDKIDFCTPSPTSKSSRVAAAAETPKTYNSCTSTPCVDGKYAKFFGLPTTTINMKCEQITAPSIGTEYKKPTLNLIIGSGSCSLSRSNSNRSQNSPCIDPKYEQFFGIPSSAIQTQSALENKVINFNDIPVTKHELKLADNDFDQLCISYGLEGDLFETRSLGAVKL